MNISIHHWLHFYTVTMFNLTLLIHPICLPAVNMALNVPGLIMVIVFYLLILGTGVFAAWKSKKALKGTGDRREALLLGNRNIDWLVGILTMTGKLL